MASGAVRVHGAARLARWYERLTLVRAVGTIVAVAVTLVCVAGVLERLVEPETFTNIGLALWWAVTTVTTVGYGDVVPHTVAGRTVAMGLMLVGLSLIPTLTSVIVSVLITKRMRDGDDTQAVQRIEERLARIEARLDAASGLNVDP